MFDQPELEAILRQNLTQYDAVTLRGNSEVTALTQDAGGVRVDVTDRATGEHDVVRAAYVLGCDGANSLVRAAIGASMQDLRVRRNAGWSSTWTPTADLGQWEGVHQLCDPARAGTYMRVGQTRYRWEFRLRPGETADDFRDLARLHPLIAPWTGDVPVDRAAARAGRPSTPSAPSSPTGGATGGCSCSATPPTSPRRSSARACAPACATR